MRDELERLLVVLAVGSAAAMGAKRVGVPYNVALVIVGLVVAFMDVRPLTPGHLLVVPRAHAANLEALDEDLWAHMFAVAHQLARALRNSAVPTEGVNFFLADGVAAGQEVFHVHLHLIARYHGDVAVPRGGVRGVIPDKQNY